MKLLKRNKIWHIRYRDSEGNNTSVSTHCRTEMEAQMFFKKWIKDGTPNSSYLKTLKEVLDYYYDNHGQYQKSSRRISIAIKQLLKFMPELKWQNISPSVINQYKLKRNVKSSTIRYELNQIRTAQNYCIADNVLLADSKKNLNCHQKVKGTNIYLILKTYSSYGITLKVDHIFYYLWKLLLILQLERNTY